MFSFEPFDGCRMDGILLHLLLERRLPAPSPQRPPPRASMRFNSCKHNKIIANLPLDCDAYTMYYIQA